MKEREDLVKSYYHYGGEDYQRRTGMVPKSYEGPEVTIVIQQVKGPCNFQFYTKE